MPTYLGLGGSGSANGSWGNAAHWSGGIPNSVGAIAIFSSSSTSGNTALIDLPGPITVGVMNFTSTGDLGYAFINGNFIFNNGAIAAELNVNVTAASNSISFGQPITLTSNLDVDIVVAGSDVVFSGAVSGSGRLTLTGAGILELNGSNTFTGGIAIQGGILDAVSDSSLGSGAVTISNAATFRSSGTINNTIGTLSNIAGTAGSAQIVAAAATTMTLSGTLSHISQGVVNFGSIADTGTIIANFGSIQENATNSAFRIAGGTVQMGNAFNAANLLSHPGAGLTEIQNGGILDTRGFATTISNLDFDDGTIRSSVGALNVTVNDVFGAVNAQNGTVVGTVGVDSLVINADFGFSLGLLGFASWTAGVDTITMNGSANSNTLTGSSQRETINGFDGTDLLFGGGGIDTINGGNGNDTIALSASGSFVDGGADIDTLQTTGAVSLGSVSGMEAISLIGGSTLTLTNAQFESGFSATSTLSGTGTIFVGIANSGSAQVVQARSMTTAVGATIVFTVNGSTGIDVIKGGLGTTNILNGNAGADQLVGGSLADTINGGTEADKIRGDGGGDSLTGGAGADVFKFRNVSDSGIGASADTITDFVSGTDRLNFSRIDADPFTSGDQAFVFVDTVAFTNNGIAQIRWVDLGADLRVEADINGDGVADMQVLLQGAGAQVLSAADFVL